MRIVSTNNGEIYFRKRRVRIEELGHAREITFSCYQHYPFLNRDRARQWFIDALLVTRQRFAIDLWAFVIMPEHVHLLINPREPDVQVGRVAGFLKEKVARTAIRHLELHAPEWLPRITVREGKRTRRRFWQPGGGYDRNITEVATLENVINYIHLNPVRRGLVDRPEDWKWSSATWYAGLAPVPIEMDATLPHSHVVAGKQS